jgi:hypothetical protein
MENFEEFLQKELDKLPYTKHLDDGQYNDGQVAGFELGARWALSLFAVISRFNSDTFIDNVCLSYRHDFGLMAEQDRQRLRFECKEWMRAISNNWEYFKNGL